LKAIVSNIIPNVRHDRFPPAARLDRRMMTLRRWLLAACLSLLPACWPAPVKAAPPMSELVQAELVAEPAAIRPGEDFWVGIRLRIKEHWHVYWRNPGDSGEAPSVKWQLPQGFSAGPIVWLVPQRIPVAHLANFGYAGETVLLTRITPPASIDAAALVALQANVSWLVCEKECIPGEEALSVKMPVAGTGVPVGANPEARALFEAARAALPQPSPWPARMDLTPDSLTLRVEAAGLKRDAIRSAYFFPNAETLVQHAAPQGIEVTPEALTLHLRRSPLSTSAPEDAGGVLVIEEVLGASTARQAFELTNVTLAGAPASAHQGASLAAFFQAALGALLGGVILNLMPCVFPVLSVKVLGLIKYAGQTPVQLRLHGFAYTFGVLTAFLVLAIALLTLRAAGAEVGWGFQLQSPLTIAILAYVMFAMALSLSGAFFFGTSVQGLGLGLAQRPGLPGSFFAGVLAAVVATPCTAPFMGAAVGFALTQPAPISVVVLLFLGLGLALPFLLLTLAPQLVGRLPRPGPWMITFKQLLAFPLYATVAWLVWVLSQQVGPSGLLAAMIGLVLIGLAAWTFNFSQTAGMRARRAALGAFAATIAALAVTLAAVARDWPGSEGAEQTSLMAGAERFTQRRLDELLADNRAVFVNMTAAWCITCLVNERTALATDAVKAAFARKNVAYLKGDWTNRNPEISRVLERHGRSGVPLYLLYAGRAEPTILPQILTPAMVLEQIERIDTPGSQRKASLSTTSKE
jgi:thiol:disulfide interchange protein DsbD